MEYSSVSRNGSSSGHSATRKLKRESSDSAGSASSEAKRRREVKYTGQPVDTVPLLRRRSSSLAKAPLPTDSDLIELEIQHAPEVGSAEPLSLEIEQSKLTDDNALWSAVTGGKRRDVERVCCNLELQPADRQRAILDYASPLPGGDGGPVTPLLGAVDRYAHAARRRKSKEFGKIEAILEAGAETLLASRRLLRRVAETRSSRLAKVVLKATARDIERYSQKIRSLKASDEGYEEELQNYIKDLFAAAADLKTLRAISKSSFKSVREAARAQISSCRSALQAAPPLELIKNIVCDGGEKKYLEAAIASLATHELLTAWSLLRNDRRFAAEAHALRASLIKNWASFISSLEKSRSPSETLRTVALLDPKLEEWSLTKLQEIMKRLNKEITDKAIVAIEKEPARKTEILLNGFKELAKLIDSGSDKFAFVLRQEGGEAVQALCAQIQESDKADLAAQLQAWVASDKAAKEVFWLLCQLSLALGGLSVLGEHRRLINELFELDVLVK